MAFFDTLLFPLEWFVALVMVGFHDGFTAIGMNATSGWTWALSVIGLVVVLRIMLIPLFVKQIKTSRRMQLIQPEMQKIQKKYKGKKDAESRQKMTEETMALYKDSGTNPFSSCLPILVQMPFFYGLFRVLNSLDEIGAGKTDAIGPITQQVAAQADAADLGANGRRDRCERKTFIRPAVVKTVRRAPRHQSRRLRLGLRLRPGRGAWRWTQPER